jgi:hypothetical protein
MDKVFQKLVIKLLVGIATKIGGANKAVLHEARVFLADGEEPKINWTVKELRDSDGHLNVTKTVRFPDGHVEEVKYFALIYANGDIDYLYRGVVVDEAEIPENVRDMVRTMFYNLQLTTQSRKGRE